METKLLKKAVMRNETDVDINAKIAITIFGQRVTGWHKTEKDAWREVKTPEGIARVAAATAYVIMQDHKEKDHGDNQENR